MALTRHETGDAVFQIGSEPGKLWISVAFLPLTNETDWQEEMVEISPEDMEKHGYVTWRPASEKPETDGEFQVCVFWAEKMRNAVRAFDGEKWKELFSDERITHWLKIPSLPGKAQP